MECKCEHKTNDYGDDVRVMNQLVNMISMREHFASFVYDVFMCCSTLWFQLSTRAVIASTPHKRRWCWWCKAVLGRKERWAKKATDNDAPNQHQQTYHRDEGFFTTCHAHWNEGLLWVHILSKQRVDMVGGFSVDELLIIYKSCGFCMTREDEGLRKGKIDIKTCERSDSDKQCTTYVTKSRPANVGGWRMSRIICFYLSDFEFSFLSSFLPQKRKLVWAFHTEDGENEMAKKKYISKVEKPMKNGYRRHEILLSLMKLAHEGKATKPKSMWHKQMFSDFSR